MVFNLFHWLVAVILDRIRVWQIMSSDYRVIFKQRPFRNLLNSRAIDLFKSLSDTPCHFLESSSHFLQPTVLATGPTKEVRLALMVDSETGGLTNRVFPPTTIVKNPIE